jgi:hypothetical protein
MNSDIKLSTEKPIINKKLVLQQGDIILYTDGYSGAVLGTREIAYVKREYHLLNAGCAIRSFPDMDGLYSYLTNLSNNKVAYLLKEGTLNIEEVEPLK